MATTRKVNYQNRQNRELLYFFLCECSKKSNKNKCSQKRDRQKKEKKKLCLYSKTKTKHCLLHFLFVEQTLYASVKVTTLILCLQLRWKKSRIEGT